MAHTIPAEDAFCILVDESLHAVEAGRVIVQCVDEVDEMQRWLEGRE